MATLTPQPLSYTGVTPTFTAADAAGDVFTYKPGAVVYVKNDGGASIDVSITTQRTAQQGFAPADSTVTVPAGGEAAIGNLDRRAWADTDGNVNLTYTDVTSVTVAVVVA